MKAIVTRESRGVFDAVGMGNRTVVIGLKTRRGVLNRARIFATNIRSPKIRVEWYIGDSIYGEPRLTEILAVNYHDTKNATLATLHAVAH